MTNRRPQLLGVLWLLIGAATLALFIPSLVVAHHLLQVPCAGRHCFDHQVTPGAARALRQHDLSVVFYGNYYTGLAAVFAAVWSLLGVLMVLRKPSEPIALFAAMTFVSFGCSLLGVMNAPAAEGYPWAPVAQLFNNLGFLSLFILLYMFPNGRFVPGWTRWLSVIIVFLQGVSTIAPHSVLNADNWPGPLPVLPFTTLIFTALFAQIYRYRRVSGQIERQQTKWIVLGASAALLSFFAIVTVQDVVPSFNQTGSPAWMVTLTLAIVIFLFIPVSFAIAILRYRLWDIDVLINRTLVYGSLTISIAAVYIGGVIALQSLFRAITSQTSDLAIAIVTLAVAALFNPWRRRVQSFVDRRFYRSRYDATRALASFNARLRDEVDVDQLTGDMLRVLQETVQPASANIWLPDREGAS